jgi:hypothetical protein
VAACERNVRWVEVRGMIDRGELPVIRIGARDRVAPAALDAWLARASVYTPNHRPNSARRTGRIGQDRGERATLGRRRVVRLISI